MPQWLAFALGVFAGLTLHWISTNVKKRRPRRNKESTVLIQRPIYSDGERRRIAEKFMDELDCLVRDYYQQILEAICRQPSGNRLKLEIGRNDRFRVALVRNPVGNYIGWGLFEGFDDRINHITPNHRDATTWKLFYDLLQATEDELQVSAEDIAIRLGLMVVPDGAISQLTPAEDFEERAERGLSRLGEVTDMLPGTEENDQSVSA